MTNPASMASRPFVRVLLLSALIAGSAACSRTVTSTPGNAPNLEKWVAEVKNRPAPPLEPLPVMQQFETFEYAAQTGRRISIEYAHRGTESMQRVAEIMAPVLGWTAEETAREV